MTSVVSLGYAQAGTSVLTVSMNVGSAVPIGDIIVVFVYSAPVAQTGGAVVDSQGNIYTKIVGATGGNPNIGAYQSTVTKPLSTSDTITYSQTSSTSTLAIQANDLSGYSGIDAPYTNTEGTVTTAYSVTGGSVPVIANELNLGFLATYQHPANPAPGWSTLVDNTLPDLGTFYTSSQINPIVSPLTFSGTNTNAQLACMILAFIPASNPFVPQPRNKIMALQQRPHSIGLAPTQTQGVRITIPLILTSVLGGASNSGSAAIADLMMEDSEGIINNIQGMFVDASGMPFPMRIFFLETQQTIFVPALSQGYYPIAVGQQGQLKAIAWSHSGTDTANNTISIQFLNVPVTPFIWGAIGN